ncbi:hypothetical protein DL93DRAFT_2228274 [Clavulina sp. PMI_390]|nr:hypothetical protein DL93DRAFT_2228274 [Clavulina sp. PMI_390]
MSDCPNLHAANPQGYAGQFGYDTSLPEGFVDAVTPLLSRYAPVWPENEYTRTPFTPIHPTCYIAECRNFDNNGWGFMKGEHPETPMINDTAEGSDITMLSEHVISFERLDLGQPSPPDYVDPHQVEQVGLQENTVLRVMSRSRRIPANDPTGPQNRTTAPTAPSTAPPARAPPSAPSAAVASALMPLSSPSPAPPGRRSKIRDRRKERANKPRIGRDQSHLARTKAALKKIWHSEEYSAQLEGCLGRKTDQRLRTAALREALMQTAGENENFIDLRRMLKRQRKELEEVFEEANASLE